MPAVVLVLLSAACFGTTGTAQAYGPELASSAAVGLTRIVAGGALLGLLAWWGARRRPGAGRISRTHAVTALVGGAAVLAYQPTFFAGARLNGVLVGAVVTLGAAPVLTGVLEWALSRELPSRAWFAGTTLAVAGVVLLSGLLEEAGGDLSPRGLLASLGAAFSYAVYTLAAKRLLTAGWEPVSVVGSIFATAAVLGTPWLLLVDLTWIASPSGAGMVAWLAVVTIAVAYVLFAQGLQALRASTVSTLTLAEPLTASVLGIALLDERLTATGWAGIGVLLAGVVALAASGRHPARGVDATRGMTSRGPRSVGDRT